MSAPTFTVDLPLPPSTNALFANRKGGGGAFVAPFHIRES